MAGCGTVHLVRVHLGLAVGLLLVRFQQAVLQLLLDLAMGLLPVGYQRDGLLTVQLLQHSELVDGLLLPGHLVILLLRLVAVGLLSPQQFLHLSVHPVRHFLVLMVVSLP